MFTISAFGDEIADDLVEQLRVLNELNIPCLDVRGVWGKNVLALTDDEAKEVKRLCDEHNVSIPAIGSPIGKSPLADPIENELTNLARAFEVATILGTNQIRVFSFYPPNDEVDDDALAGSIVRLRTLAAEAAKNGFELFLENEKGIVGDTVDHCHALMQGVDNPAMHFLWDPANFVQVGEAQVTENAWARLGPVTSYVHIKDAVLDDGGVRPPGEGDGQVGELLQKLNENGYNGILALEPHLAIASHSSGFSGPDGMAVAVKALRKLMAERGLAEAG